MRFKKGMKVKSLKANGIGSTMNRIFGSVHTIWQDSDDIVYYMGLELHPNEINECTSHCPDEFEIIKTLITETDYLDAFQNNFKEGV